jgi:hypothetical protein
MTYESINKINVILDTTAREVRSVVNEKCYINHKIKLNETWSYFSAILSIKTLAMRIQKSSSNITTMFGH